MAALGTKLFWGSSRGKRENRNQVAIRTTAFSEKGDQVRGGCTNTDKIQVWVKRDVQHQHVHFTQELFVHDPHCDAAVRILCCRKCGCYTGFSVWEVWPPCFLETNSSLLKEATVRKAERGQGTSIAKDRYSPAMGQGGMTSIACAPRAALSVYTSVFSPSWISEKGLWHTCPFSPLCAAPLHTVWAHSPLHGLLMAPQLNGHGMFRCAVSWCIQTSGAA